MLLLGHRGYSDQYSENTMLAFSKAIESGFDGIETDVHKTKDGVLVLCHDEKINRTSDGKGYIKDMTYEELCAYNFGTKENPQRIPLLKELLELCKGKNVKINLEIKTNKIQYPGIELESYQMAYCGLNNYFRLLLISLPRLIIAFCVVIGEPSSSFLCIKVSSVIPISSAEKTV